MGLKSPPEFFTDTIWLLIILLLGLVTYYLIHIGNNYISEDHKIKITTKKIITILGLAVFLYLMTYIFRKYTTVKDIFNTLIFSVVMAYVLNPLVNYIESRGAKRTYSVIIVYGIIIGILIIIAFFIFPGSIKEIKTLINSLPNYISYSRDLIDDLYIKYGSSLESLPPLSNSIGDIILDNVTKLEEYVVSGISKFISGIIDNLSKIVSIILMPILTFYFLNDKKYFKEKVTNLIPRRFRSDVLELAYEIDNSVSKYVRGRLIMAVTVGIGTTIMLSIFDVNFALVIGMITAIGDIIPYIGPFIGYIPAVIFAFMSSPIKVVWVSIAFILIQWAANNILGPKILGDSTGLHPLVVLLTIIIGGAIFGVFGMIFSVPVVAIIRVIFKFYIRKGKLPKKED